MQSMLAAMSETRLQPGATIIHYDAEPGEGLRAGTLHALAGDRVSGYVAPAGRASTEIRYRDTHGDEVVFRKEGKRLRKYVNGPFARDISKLSFQWNPYEIRDQATWGGSPEFEHRAKVAFELQALAKSCDVPNNLPQRPNPPRGKHMVLTFDLSRVHSDNIKLRVQEATRILTEDVPALTFREQANAQLRLTDVSGGGCWSHLGYRNPHNEMNLDPSWGEGDGPPLGTVLHEFLHFLGVAHEHQRDDRHRFVVIDPAKVKPGWEDQFTADANIHPFRYDSASIMHYPSGSGLDCGPAQWAKVGQRRQLSQLDKLFLNMLYPPSAGINSYNPRRGATGLYYCGRRVMENNSFPFGCVGCDGRCGPTDGPNCPACIMYGCSMGDVYPVIRRGSSQSGESGLFYCGKRFCAASGSHDGKCGPNNGPNCPTCRQLTTKQP